MLSARGWIGLPVNGDVFILEKSSTRGFQQGPVFWLKDEMLESGFGERTTSEEVIGAIFFSCRMNSILFLIFLDDLDGEARDDLVLPIFLLDVFFRRSLGQ